MLWSNRIVAYGIDNWEWGDPALFHRLHELVVGENRSTILEGDCFAIDRSLIEPGIDVYFYDGDHSYEAQYEAFTYFDAVLADTFIAIVDDYKTPETARAVADAIRDSGYRELLAVELRADRDRDREGWWNGLWVGVLQKGGSTPGRD